MTAARRKRPARKAPSAKASSTKASSAKGKAKAKAVKAKASRVTGATSGDGPIRRDLEVHREELAAQNAELRRANAALANASERLAQLYDGAPIAYFTLDDGGIVVEANQAGAELLASSRQFLFGRSFEDMIVPSSRESFRNFRRGLVDRGARGVLETMLAVTGQRLHVRIEAARLPSVGTGDGHCLLCVCDETERHQLDAERRVLDGRLAEARRVESLWVLSGGIAQSFDDILSGARESADVVLRDVARTSSLREAVGKVRDDILRGERLAKQMLSYAGRERLQAEPLDVSHVVRSMSSLLTSSTPTGVSLDLTLANDLPLVVADASQLRQIVMNLMQNAREAIAPGVGKIALRTRCQASDEPHGERVVLEIVDDGCGMDEPTRRSAFDPFFSTKLASRGVGLAVVQGNVRAHRGTVEVETRVNGGTTIRVLLPTQRSAGAQPHANDT